MTFKAGEVSENNAAPNDVAKVDKHSTADKTDSSKERSSKKNRKKEKEHVEKPSSSINSRLEKRLLVLPLEASVTAILLLILLGAFYVVHCVWAAAEAYSAPSIVLTSHTPNGGLHVFDDF